MNKNKINKKLVEQLGLDLDLVNNYFNLNQEEQVEFINNCFENNIEKEQIEQLLGWSWTKITDGFRHAYYKSKTTKRYELKDTSNKSNIRYITMLDLEDFKKDNDNTYVLLEDFNSFKDEVLNAINDKDKHKSNLLLDVRTNLCAETTTKQYKIDKDISERFDKFADENCVLNKQVLVSMALEQFLDKYSEEEKED